MVLATSAGVQIEVRDPVGTAAGTNAAFAVWASGDTYASGDLVRGSNGKYYVSLAGDNTGNDPISSAGSWTQVRFVRVFNTNEPYAIGDIAQSTLDGLLYTSLTAANTGNEPSTSPTYWEPAVESSGGSTTVMEYFSELIEATDATYAWPDGFVGTVYVTGAGGGGGGATFSGDGGYGGTGGQSCARVPIFIDQSEVATTAITIGAGGPGGASGTNSGSPGGQTSVGDYITLSGGGAGLANAGDASPANGTDGTETEVPAGPAGEGGRYFTGGTGGQGYDGTSAAGGDGGAGMTENYRVSSLDNTGLGGAPASGYEAGGGGGSYGDGGSASVPTANRGGGGSGGLSGGAGQAGADGFIFLEWWAPVTS